MEISLLRSLISNGTVIPVLGTDLATVSVDLNKVDPRNYFRPSLNLLQNPLNGKINLTINQYLSLRLADISQLENLNDIDINLNTIFLRSDFSTQEKYDFIHTEYFNLNSAESSLALFEQLAAVPGFKIYIHTGLDDFLSRAFAKNADREPYTINTQLLNTINNNFDVPIPTSSEPIIFNIFGSITAKAYSERAITDEHYIETILKLHEQIALQHSSFNLLFELFQNKSLLIIGSSVPDWLMRFLIRLISLQRLDGSNNGKYISDQQTLKCIEYPNFLNKYNGKILTSNLQQFLQPLDFLNTLAGLLAIQVEPVKKKYNERVFISFINNDRRIAKRLSSTFTRYGIEVYLDEKNIDTGTEIDDQIRTKIRDFEFFVPLISGNSLPDEKNYKKYVYREWDMAGYQRKIRTRDFQSFIQPICIGNFSQSGYDSFFEGIKYEKVDPTDQNLNEFVERFITRNKVTAIV